MPTFCSTFPARLAIPRLLAVLLLLGLWHGRAPELPTVSAASERHGGAASTGLADEARAALTGAKSGDEVRAPAVEDVVRTPPSGHSSELELDKDNAANGRLPSGSVEEGETTSDGEANRDVGSYASTRFESQGTSSESLVSSAGSMARRLHPWYNLDDLKSYLPATFKEDAESDGSTRKSRRSRKRKSETEDNSAADESEPSKRKKRSLEKEDGATSNDKKSRHAKSRKSPSPDDKSVKSKSKSSRRKKRDGDKEDSAAKEKGKKSRRSKSEESSTSEDNSIASKAKTSKDKERDGDTKESAAKEKKKKSRRSRRKKHSTTKDKSIASKSKTSKDKERDGDTKESAAKEKKKKSRRSRRKKHSTTKGKSIASKSKTSKDKERDGDTKESAAKEKKKKSRRSRRKKRSTTKDKSIASKSKSSRHKERDGDKEDSGQEEKSKRSRRSRSEESSTSEDSSIALRSKSSKDKERDGDKEDSGQEEKSKRSRRSRSEESSTSEDSSIASRSKSSRHKERDGDKEDSGRKGKSKKSRRSRSEESSTSEDSSIVSRSRSSESGKKRKSRRERSFSKKKKSKKSRRSKRRRSEEASDSHRFSDSLINSPIFSLENVPRAEVSALDARDAIRLTVRQLIESPETRLEDVEALVRHAGPVIEQDEELVNAVLAKVVAETSAATARLHDASEVLEAAGEQPKEQEQGREDQLLTQQDAGAQGQETSDATAQIDNTQEAAAETHAETAAETHAETAAETQAETAAETQAETAAKEDSKLEGVVNMQEPETEMTFVMVPQPNSNDHRDDDSNESSISARDPQQKLIVHYSGGHVTSYAASMVGRRPTDEDALLVNFQLPNIPGNCLTALFDGHGGSEVSFFVAHNAPQFFEKLTNLEPQTIENAIKSLDSAVIKLPELRHAGTTGVFVFIERLHTPKKVLAMGREIHPLLDQVEENDEEEIRFQPLENLICEDEALLASRLNLPAKDCPAPPKNRVITIGEDNKLFQLTVANVGDSRAMLIHEDGTYTRLSRDHTPSAAGEQPRIEKAGGFVEYSDTFRVNGELSVSRAFGDREMKANPYLFADGQIITAIPEIRTFYAKPSDLLLLACDGLFEGENMTPGFIARYIHERRRTIKHDDDYEHLVSSLLDEAYIRGSEDNISAILTRVREPYSTHASQGFSIVNGAGMLLQSGRGSYALATEGDSATESVED
uniref:protein-serine/threonine phosphatase n=2 Tax=Toxoplasma gondii (strain ATCC 50861 / VEG) TaxID=432359 RepID=A0A0F7UXJ6_TOXGV|nr:TPA: protein phosphatase 2C, putative [Toxoplasma gondii VEG]